jgi:hypothetical protein
MSKSFTHAGVSKLDGEFKVRFCNDALRTKVLAKNGHKDIDIIELKNPMPKEEIVSFLLSINFDNGNKEIRAALESAQEKRTVAPKAASAKAKAPAKKSKPSLDAIAARAKVATKAPAKKTTVSKAEVLAQLENEPF